MLASDQFRYHMEFDNNTPYDWYIVYSGAITEDIYIIQYIRNINEDQVLELIRETNFTISATEPIKIQTIYKSEESIEYFCNVENVLTELTNIDVTEKKMIMLEYNGEYYDVISV